MIIKKKCYYCTDGKIHDITSVRKQTSTKMIICKTCNGTGYYNEEIDMDKIQTTLNYTSNNLIEVIDNSKKLELAHGIVINYIEAEPIELLYPSTVFELNNKYIMAVIKDKTKYSLVHIPSKIKIFTDISKNIIHKYLDTYPNDIVEQTRYIYKYDDFFKTELIEYIKQSYVEYMS